MSPLAVLVGLVLCAALGIRVTVFSSHQVRRMRWRARFKLKPGPGFASSAELWMRWGRLAALHHGGRARPSMRLPERLVTPAHRYAIRLGRAQYARRLYARCQDQVLILAPPRVGKTGLMADWVIDHPGPVVATETRPDIFTATAGYRARLGPLHVFNPEGVAGIPSTFRWSIVGGCQDPGEALRRAEDLAEVAVADAGEMGWWVSKAAAALAAGFQAAALQGASVDDVWQWVNAPSARAPLVRDALGHPEASAALLATLTELDKQGKTADSVRITMSKSLSWLTVPALRAIVTGPGAGPFDVAGFTRDNGTVYMLTPGGDKAPAAPLNRCFASFVHRAARMHSQTLPGRVLDPGLLFALDELHIAPVDLPSWLADSAGFGIQVRAVVHSTGQLEEKYGRAGLATVWGTTGTKMFLPGIHDPKTLEDISRLCGRLPGDGGDGKQDWIAPAEFVAQLPDWRALVFRTNLRPVVVKFRPYWRRAGFRLRQAPPVPVLMQPQVPVAAVEAEITDIAGRLPELSRVVSSNGADSDHA